MSLTGTQLLTISEALHDKCAAAENVDFVFPTATRFTDKADYWRFANTLNDTQKEKETSLINAVWISYLRFEDSSREQEFFVKTIFYELTLFNESTFERLDETDTPDAFNAKVSKTDHEHDEAVFSLQSEFGPVDEIDLADADLADSHTNRLAQIDNTERLAPCPFIADGKVLGSVTRFECQFRTRIC